MRKIQIIPSPQLMGTPRCQNCAAQMWLVSIEPDKLDDHDMRTFECPRCQDVIVEVVKYK